MDGDGWTEKSKVPFKLACCHCGLVHVMVLVAGRKGTEIGIAARQDLRSTAQRRHRMAKIVPQPKTKTP